MDIHFYKHTDNAAFEKGQLYSNLPPHLVNQCPMWFGAEDKSPTYL